MRNKCIKLLAFVAVFIGLNSIMSFLFVPVDGASKMMWENYRRMESLDTIYVGASVCQSTFNPVIIDEILGTNSYNMGTPSQPVDLSYVAIETAIKEHSIKRVVFGFGYFSLATQNSQQAEAAFIQAKNQQGTLIEAMMANAKYIYENIGDSVSVNFLIPWVNNHVTFNADAILENVNKKMDNYINKTESETSIYEKRGMRLYTDVINYDELGDDNSWNWYQPEFSVAAVSKMREICELCKQNDVELIIVNTPRPTFDITTYLGDYYGQYLWLKDFFAEYDVDYYDFNFAKPEVFISKPDYYYNFEHLNAVGAEAFSERFAEFLRMREQEDDDEKYFYNWEEYLESINYTYE